MTPSSGHGTALLADPDRFGDVWFLGLDETDFLRQAPYYRTQFTTSIVDVGNGQLMDVVPARRAEEPTKWLKARGDTWLAKVLRVARLRYYAWFARVCPNRNNRNDQLEVHIRAVFNACMSAYGTRRVRKELHNQIIQWYLQKIIAKVMMRFGFVGYKQLLLFRRTKILWR